MLSAIADIETAGPMLRVKGLEPSDLVTLDELASRLGYSEEYTRKLLAGGIHSLDNPPLPYTNVDYGDTIWSFKDVVSWLYNKQVLEDSDLLERAMKTFEIEYFLKSRDINSFEVVDRLSVKTQKYDRPELRINSGFVLKDFGLYIRRSHYARMR
mgnify:CR=1 FL=1